jgi:hypothetical protein
MLPTVSFFADSDTVAALQRLLAKKAGLAGDKVVAIVNWQYLTSTCFPRLSCIPTQQLNFEPI